ncbi:MAG TPA: polymorphic toxin type 33 domain-containing protein [Thermoanaerobaculia bacterium]|nr:polymorphic toxin type 33 domain-containing protein [Thermoanaerobaculia bacterium]
MPQAVEALEHLKAKPDGGPFSWTAGQYGYDGAGNITAIGNEAFVYDKVGRLKSATVLGPDLAGLQTQTFTYDVYGNLTSTSKLGQTVLLPVDASTNRLNTLDYDASGNVITSGTQHYDYDAAGMLNGVHLGSNLQPRIIYAYTADDERLFAYDVSTGTTHWTLRGFDNKVLRDFRQQGSAWSVDRDYVYRDGLLLAALKSSGSVEHYTLDQLGTPRLITDGAGHKVGYHVYWPFGEEWSPGSAQEASPLKFTGHERDADPSAGSMPLDYMHARYYGAGWGRFLCVDPALDLIETAENPQQWNRYSYVRNNPIGHNDPTGKCADVETCAWDFTKWAAPIAIRFAARQGSSVIAKAALQYRLQRLSNFQYAKPVVVPPALSEAQKKPADASTAATTDEGSKAGSQDKRPSGAEVDMLGERGVDVHELKQEITGDKKVSKYDLFKDKDGNIYVKPKNGPGQGEPTGLNLNDFTVK